MVFTAFATELASSAINASPVLISRMILGYQHVTPSGPLEEIENCFISLLNGTVFDVDKFDYLLRDTWASGAYASEIDIERILESLCIRKIQGKFELCFQKSSMSAIQGVLDSSAFQNLWMLPHHKNVYENHLLKSAVNRLAEILFPDENKKIGNIFDYKAYLSPISCGKYKLYLPTDSEIVYMLKDCMAENSFAEEWLTRKHKLKPLWKSFVEFDKLFERCFKTEDFNEDSRLRLYAQKTVEDILSKNKLSTDCAVVFTEVKASKELTNEIKIIFNSNGQDDIIDYSKLSLPMTQFKGVSFPYVFIEKESIPIVRAEVINRLRALRR